MAAGVGMQLLNNDNSLAVEVSSQSPVGGVADGRTSPSQSGIVKSHMQYQANQITHSGTTSATSLEVANFSNFSGNEGSIVASTLVVTGSDAVENAPIFPPMEKNQVSQRTLSGSQDDFTLRSSVSIVEGITPWKTPLIRMLILALIPSRTWISG